MLSGVAQLFGVSTRDQRIAVLDVGSNSVRLVVFLAETRVPAVLFNEKALCGLGEEIGTTGRLHGPGKEIALAALKRFRAMIDRCRCDAVLAIGTAAVRDAEDGAEFVAEIKRETGLEIRIADGAEEARLAAQGVLLGDPFAKGVVADLGGASMELVALDAAAPEPVGAGVTTPLGALRLNALGATESRAKLIDHVDGVLDEALGAFETKPDALYALGGSFRAFASAWMEKSEYQLRVLHGYALPRDEAIEAAEWASTLKPAELRQYAGVSERRARATPAACLALWRLLRKLKPRKLTISAFGLREGAYWERLAPMLKQADPLLDACAEIERRRARNPGFGEEVFAWLHELLDGFPTHEQRLAKASCLLVDSTWRTHPDYRALAALELVTRNAFGGFDHAGRAFVGESLLLRHKGGRKTARIEPSLAIANAEARERAAILGLAMRLGATLSGATVGLLPRTRLAISEDEVAIVMRREDAGLKGDEAVKRLDALAEALGKKGAFRFE